ncbi:SWIM zinc finger family protein [Streptacidiphilus carbonis]|uniref:SWIM zinc finger family protein n=1 Tax=Streptacidiphilus carbonis TaxID=105422 RepID=UPI000694091B|nr:hypothetical protein [Streptacidiphilus carbonis]
MSGDGAVAATPGPGAWSRRFLARLEALGVFRMEQLAPPVPQVSGLTVTAGSVGARVSADNGRGYDVWIELPVFDARQWARAEQALTDDDQVREALLDGEFPAGFEAALTRAGLSLLPARAEDLVLECSCPQWSACRHLAAVLGALAAAFDTDPFLLPAWRGRGGRRLLRHVAQRRASAADPQSPTVPPAPERPLDQRLDDFWCEGEQHRALLHASDDLAAASAGAAPEQLAPSGIMLRGKPLETLLLPAYEAFMD